MKKLILLLAIMLIATVGFAQEPEEPIKVMITATEGGSLEGSANWEVSFNKQQFQDVVDNGLEVDWALIVSMKRADTPEPVEPVTP